MRQYPVHTMAEISSGVISFCSPLWVTAGSARSSREAAGQAATGVMAQSASVNAVQGGLVRSLQTTASESGRPAYSRPASPTAPWLPCVRLHGLASQCIAAAAVCHTGPAVAGRGQAG